MMRAYAACALFAAVVGLAAPCPAEPGHPAFDARVVSFGNADTLRVSHGKALDWVRLEGISAPEKGQPFWEKARGFAMFLALDKTVRVVPKRRNAYQRELIGEVFLPDGRSLNRELVREGLAWWYSPFSDDDTLRQLEIEARNAGRNIWTQLDPIPPWDFWKYRRSESGLGQ